MARKNFQVRGSSQVLSVDTEKFKDLGWRELVRMASDLGVYRRGMNKAEVLAALTQA